MSEAVATDFHVVLECGHHRTVSAGKFYVSDAGDLFFFAPDNESEMVAVYHRGTWDSCEEVGVGSPAWPISAPDGDVDEHEEASAT